MATKNLSTTAHHYSPLLKRSEVLKLIRELAVFEKESASIVVNSEEMYLKDAFGPNPVCYTIVAENTSGTGPLFAIMIFYVAYSTWKGKYIYVEDLFVTEDKRSLGIGTHMLKCAIQIAFQWGCARIQWQVLDWNQSAIDFYKKIGAEPFPEWLTFRMDRSLMEKAVLAKQDDNGAPQQRT